MSNGIADSADDVAPGLRDGDRFLHEGRYGEAEACYRTILDLRPDHAGAHGNLGLTRELLGDTAQAIVHYRVALKLAPGSVNVRRNLAKLLVRTGRAVESYPLWREELPDSSWIDSLIANEMNSGDLRLAGVYATILAGLRWGSQWYPRTDEGGSVETVPPSTPCISLSIPKLLHDIEQFRYLQSNNLVGDEFISIIAKYERVLERLMALGTPGPFPFDDEARVDIGHVYSRIVHVSDAPRLWNPLSNEWDPSAVENAYINGPSGVVVVDNFLSSEALKTLRLFCLESTIWSTTKPLGRLGSLFRDGFSCPLLLQIAGELREKLPRIIGKRYPLRHMWGYKTPHSLPGDSITHADFAAVNVNFWITPDDANLDKNTGGLIIYGVHAPIHWDFQTYNGRLKDAIRPYLLKHQAKAVIIPYRENRAVIFNSDLFHSTAEVRFKDGYENRRINITMLYGAREDDVHHPNLSPSFPNTQTTATAHAWRSFAFSRARR